MGYGRVARTTIDVLANSPHCVHSPQLHMRTSYAWPHELYAHHMFSFIFVFNCWYDEKVMVFNKDVLHETEFLSWNHKLKMYYIWTARKFMKSKTTRILNNQKYL